MRLARLRLWLLIVALVCGQAAMLAHGVEHHDADEAAHVCLVCLAGHGVDGAVPPPALPAVALVPPDRAAGDAPPTAPPSPAAVVAAARGPPRRS